VIGQATYSDSARASDSMFCIDFVRVTNCFYDYDYDCYRNIMIQEAQLSQRDRATLRVIEYFAKSVRSLKIIRNDTVE